MILTCPQCATRYNTDASKFPAAGRSVRCAKCGTVWHQIGPTPEPDPEAELVFHEPPPREPDPPPVPEPPVSIAAQPRVAAFAPAAVADAPFVGAHDEDAAAPPPPSRAGRPWLGPAALAGGWLLLVALILVIGWAAVSFRDTIATWLPQTSSFYAAAGLPVNPMGMEFADVTRDIETEDGQQVLAVTGRIVNRSNHELNVPLVRVALIDADRHELYHWTFVPSVSTLKPGEFAKFRTRLSSPPAGTHDLEIRFAQAGE